jgi:hypothetical protein
MASVRWWTGVLILIVIGHLFFPPPTRAATVTPVETARRIVQVGDGPVLDEQVVTVPDRLEAQWHAPNIRIRYELTIPDGPAGQGLWLARVGAPFHLSVDGQPLTPYLPFSLAGSAETHVLNGRMPFLFALPASAQTVRIEFAGTAFMPTGLAAAQWGRPAELATAHLDRYERLTHPTEVNTVLAVVLGTLALVLWSVRRDVVLLPIFAAICASLTLRDWSFTVAQLPLDAEKAYLFNSLLSISLTVTVLASLLTLANRLHWRYTRWLTAGAAGLLLPLYVTQWLPQGVVVVRLAILFAGMLNIPLCIFLLFRWRKHIAGHAAYVLMFGLGLLLAVSVHDLSWTLGYLPPMRISYVPLAFAVLLLCYAYITADHVLRSLHLVENANIVLNRQIEKTRAELESSHHQLTRLQASETRRSERQQFVQSLVQGLGQRLASLADDVNSGQVDTAGVQSRLEMSLQSLRQLLSAHRSDGALVVTLATWRQSWQPRLDVSGIAMGWHIDDSADEVRLPAPRLAALIGSLNRLMDDIWKQQRETSVDVTTPSVGLGTATEADPAGPATAALQLEATLRQGDELQVVLEGRHLQRPEAPLIAHLRDLWLQNGWAHDFVWEPSSSTETTVGPVSKDPWRLIWRGALTEAPKG